MLACFNTLYHWFSETNKTTSTISSMDKTIVQVAAAALFTMGAASFASTLPIVGSLALFVPAMASPLSGIFPLAYSTGAVYLGCKLWKKAQTIK